ncbi:DUF4215 domain-containing protein [Nannocystis bainbridge]|uniref:DUF4215 domain-containing protein n=1 Tax=Nannocystis bainbridge TaxID=2995303 RepID=A0ABT5DXE3_9BACT|nr:DUF4215 domain-containing protein [Nannocystis bainbridge]MDC0718268.1 DUF4215 domain-containing protein [Nannocystis bainbridge]
MSRSVFIALVALAGCTAPGLDHFLTAPPQQDATTRAESSSSGSTGGDPDSSTGTSVMTSTTSTGTTDGPGGSETDSDGSSGDGSSSSTTGSVGECGDGLVDVDEECDDANADPDDGCAACFRDRWVFATSMMFQPDLIGGLAGADSLCGQLANQAGLGDNWQSYRAWLSDSSTSAGERIFAGMGRYRRRDGVVIAENFEQFLSGTLSATFDVDEFGQTALGGAWTGTLPDGTAAVGVSHCDDWTIDDLAAIQGHYGQSGAIDGRWTFDPDAAFNPTSCAGTLRLYCFEGA